jgi:hypothetical protein
MTDIDITLESHSLAHWRAHLNEIASRFGATPLDVAIVRAALEHLF